MRSIKFMIAFVLATVVLAVSAFAAVSIDFSVETATTDTGAECYKVVVSQTEDTGADWRALQTKIKFNYEKIVPIDWYDGSVPSYTGEAAEYPFVFSSFKNGRTSTGELQRPQVPVWTINGENSEVIVELYWPSFEAYPIIANDTVIYEMYFKYADGVTNADLVDDDFNVYFIEYGSTAKHFYGHEDASKNDIVVTNNVIPVPVTAITVPVVAGDVVYLQDGSFATAATTGDYNVLLTAGYVVVNTGKTAQKTYYVDGRNAALIHTNGVVATDSLTLRDRTPAADGNDKNGLRFVINHNPESRNSAEHSATEMGFIMTAETAKVIEACGENYVLDMTMVATNIGTDEKPVYAAKKGVAYSAAEEVDIVYNKTSDNLWQIAGVFYGIPVTEAGVKTTIASRPYYKVGDTYVYGETVKSTLYDVAVALSEDESFEFASQSMKDYIQEVLGAVGGAEDELPNELMINLDGLFD